MFTNPPASIDPKVIEVLLTAVTLLSTHSRFTLALARSITLQVFGSCYKFIGIVIHYVMVPLCLLSLDLEPAMRCKYAGKRRGRDRAINST